MEAGKAKKCQKLELFAEVVVKRWPNEKELEMPDILRLSINEGILRLSELQG